MGILNPIPAENPGQGDAAPYQAAPVTGSSFTIEEVDGTPSGVCTKFVLPNGTLTIVAGVATYTPTGGAASAPVTASITGAYTPDCAGLGAVASFELTFTGSVTINAPINTTPGQTVNIKMIQGGLGGWTTTLNAAYKFPFGLIPAWGVTTGDESFISGYVDTVGHVLCGGGTKYV